MPKKNVFYETLCINPSYIYLFIVFSWQIVSEELKKSFISV